MYGKAFAPEYQGELRTALGVNSSYEDVRGVPPDRPRLAGISQDTSLASSET
ncbi:tetratricopeptide repeat protein, partial [Streptomyces sp. NPDC001939]